MYHIILTAKYRRAIFDQISDTLIETCRQIQQRYEIRFLEMGIANNHLHLLIQSVPTLSVTDIIKMIKSILAREILKRHPGILEQMYQFEHKREFWSDGYFANTVGGDGEVTLKRYIKDNNYQQLQ